MKHYCFYLQIGMQCRVHELQERAATRTAIAFAVWAMIMVSSMFTLVWFV